MSPEKSFLKAYNQHKNPQRPFKIHKKDDQKQKCRESIKNPIQKHYNLIEKTIEIEIR